MNNKEVLKGEDIKMFDIVYVKENEGQGSEQTGDRPYIIVQNDKGNKHSPTVLGMALTTVLKKEYMPTHCVIRRNSSNNLRKTSMVLGETLTQIDKKRIIRKIGKINDFRTRNEIINCYIANITGMNNNKLIKHMSTFFGTANMV